MNSRRLTRSPRRGGARYLAVAVSAQARHLQRRCSRPARSGTPATPAQVQHFVDQLNLFESIYTASESFGSPTNVDLIARGAVYGMLGVEAEMTQVPIVG